MKLNTIYISLLVISSCYPNPNKDKISAITTLPAFKIISPDGSKCINSEKLSSGNPILFVYFSPECEICQQETRELLGHINKLNHIRIYMIANEPSEATKRFCEAYRLDTAKNIFVGEDYNYSFYKAYLPPTVPFLAIYDSNRKLKKIYREKPHINLIINSVGN